MVLEVLLPEEFSMVLDWLAQGSLRDQVSRLEQAAGRSTVDGETTASDASDDGAVATEHASPAETVSTAATDFTEGLIRWAKLPPPLNQIDLSPYLLLAASFSGRSSSTPACPSVCVTWPQICFLVRELTGRP